MNNFLNLKIFFTILSVRDSQLECYALFALMLVHGTASRPYDIKGVIEMIIDNGDYYDVHKYFAQNILFRGDPDFANPYQAAARGFVDRVIEPKESRPAKRHGNIRLQSVP